MSHLPNLNSLTPLWCALLALCGIGCQTYSPYGYGGYQGNYGYPMSQPGYGQPAYGQPGTAMPYGGPTTVMPYNGTTIMPEANAPIGPPQPNLPQGGYQGGYPNSSMPPPPFVPNGGTGAAAPYPQVPNAPLRQGADGSGESFGQPGQFPDATQRPRMNTQDDHLVPDYNDPNVTPPASTQRPVPQTPGVADPASFQNELNGARRSSDRLKGMEADAAIGGPSAMLQTGGTDEVQFAPPEMDESSPTDGLSIVQTAQHVEEATRGLQPYGRAPDGQSWFRGLIDYDEQENTWYLIYNPEAEITDPQGGMISLHEHEHLSLFKGDDVALVEGRFDPSESDPNGNPKYRVGVIRRLIP